MQIRIVKGHNEQDQQVMKDDSACQVTDFTDVASDFWALYWNSETNKGEIEFSGNVKENVHITSESEIEAHLGVPLQTMLDRYQVVKDAQDAADAAQAEEETTSNMYADMEEWEKMRIREYPELGAMIVALYDTEDRAAIDAARAAVKAKWPKDNSGPIE